MANIAQQIRQEVQANYPGATVLERGRHHLLHQLPDGRALVSCRMAPLHVSGGSEEISTDWQAGTPADLPWLWTMKAGDYNAYFAPGNLAFNSGQIIRYVHPASGGEITFQPQQLQWTNDNDQIEAISNPLAIVGLVTGDTLSWPGAFGVGRDFVWQAEADRLAKRLTVASPFSAPSSTIINGGNPVLRLQFIFQKSSGVTAWVNGLAWDQAANNPVTTQSGVEFRDAQGNILWAFSPGYAVDSGRPKNQITPTTRLRRGGSSLFVEIRVPWSWLQTAVYPVTIDPTVNLQVNASANDAHAGSINNDSGRNVTTGAAISSITDNPVSPGSHGGNDEYSLGCRFVSVTVPNAATITSATFILTAQATYNASPNTVSFLVSAEAADNPVAFATAGAAGASLRSSGAASPPGNRPRTTAVSSAWNQNSIVVDTEYSIDVTSVIQEIVNRGGWASGNAIVIIVDTNTTTTLNEWQDYYSYNGSTTKAAKLNITYSSGGISIPVVMNQLRNQRIS